ncbi:MAG: hypothetical protein HY939_03370 [Gammaproteobacteria bacterium]|nr:hypothetical protein [Gammaproteobacteria bacterium]
MKALAQFAMKGRKQAFFLATLFALIPFLGWIGSALMGLVTLRKGPREGFLLLLGLSLADLFYLYFGGIGMGYVLYDSLTNNIPTFLAALYLRRVACWNNLLEMLTYLGLALILLLHLAIPDLTHWWGLQIAKLSQHLTDLTSSQLNTQIAQHAAPYATGLQAVVVISTLLFNLIIARYMQASIYHPGGLKEELYHIHLPKRLAFTLIVITLLPWLHIETAKDLIPLIVFPFACAGLSLFYDFCSKRTRGWAWLISFYALLLLALPYVCLILITVGLLDTFYNLRLYLKTNKQN